jgi:hypothetical protein
MADRKETYDADENHVSFTSDCDILQITEENSKPGKASERYRKWLEKKYGPKTPTPKGPAERPKES